MRLEELHIAPVSPTGQLPRPRRRKKRAETEKPKEISPDALFMQLFTYYHQLQTRKLQYIAAMFTAAGVFFAVWKDMGKTEFAEPFCLAATFTFMVLLQMFSRLRRHVHRVSLDVNEVAGKELLELPAYGSLAVQGITIYLYLLNTIFVSIWLTIFWNLNHWATAFLLLIFSIQIANLNILYGPEGEISIAATLRKCVGKIYQRRVSDQ